MTFGRSAILLFTVAVWCVSGASAAAQTPPPKRPPQKPAAKPAAKSPTPTPAPAKPRPADIEIVSSYTTGDKVATSTVMLKGARQRIQQGNDLVTILNCDAGQTSQMNTSTRTFLTAPFETASALPAPPPKSKGGSITYTTTITDTGEKKEMYGYPARHLKTVVTKEANATACDKKPERIESDGWYLDLPATLSCLSAPQTTARIQIDPNNENCRDEVHFVRAESPAAGYPIEYTMTATAGTDKPAVTELKVTSLKTSDLPASNFEVPSDFLEVQIARQLMVDHRPGEIGTKKPGVIRVGVAPLVNKTDRPFDVNRLYLALGESLSDSDLDIVGLKAASAAERASEAKEKDCDYMLENTVSELKKPGGGVLGKLSNTSSEEISAKVDFVLVAPGLTKPALAGSEHSGTSTLQVATGAARHVAHIVAPYIMAQYTFMSAFSSMNGGVSFTALGQTQDPVLNSVFKLIDKGSRPHDVDTSEDAAVASAMKKEVQAVFAEMQKRKKTS